MYFSDILRGSLRTHFLPNLSLSMVVLSIEIDFYAQFYGTIKSLY